MKYALALFIICISFFVNAQKPSLPVFKYVITVLPKQQQFNISFSFKTGNTNSTAMQLPDHFGSFTHAHRFVSIQKGISIDRVQLKEDDSSVVIVYHQPRQVITFNYVLKNSLKDSLPAGNLLTPSSSNPITLIYRGRRCLLFQKTIPAVLPILKWSGKTFLQDGAISTALEKIF
ncbi:MAG: hypothetical protein K2X48_18010 [Chitinophagaceae bacterium]|nr:hypothetical protein [Chitinophagaceae bacterium]